MLFNSYEFIFLFLPVTLLGFLFLGKWNKRFAATWVALASLFFYGWWNPAFVALLMGSITFNYIVGVALVGSMGRRLSSQKYWILFFGIVINLAVLGYFKYFNFFLSTLNEITDSTFSSEKIILPLGVSFFTFTQIAFLVDASRGLVREFNFIHYTLFVTYFPHLIAGPVLHHKEMMPQFDNPKTYRLNYECLAVGLTIFFIGLFKKVMLADDMIKYVKPVFDSAAQGHTLSFKESWGAALSYTLQLYFDFSGYSDMAIGLSRMFGVKLPLNFDSPYKAVNIIDFWRRWHMTLSRFLRDYLYIPLGGNRKGPVRRHVNLLTTMLLGGLWHGAGWTFVIWGGLHGIYLVINHIWHALRASLGHDLEKITLVGRLTGGFLTFIAVVFAWVFFRADSLHAALSISSAMFGLNGFSFTGHFQLSKIAQALAIVWLMPNTQQIMGQFEPALGFRGKDCLAPFKPLQWRPNWIWLACVVTMASVSLVQGDKVSEFLYFQF
ncbi:MAG: MBOAT family O-acyltransferase [Candidatus Methylumidiphilus sp.]